jgi:hypothetical protein
MLIWSKNSSSLAVSETLRYFNADEVTEEMGISGCAITPPLPISPAHTPQGSKMLGTILGPGTGVALLAGCTPILKPLIGMIHPPATSFVLFCSPQKPIYNSYSR